MLNKVFDGAGLGGRQYPKRITGASLNPSAVAEARAKPPRPSATSTLAVTVPGAVMVHVVDGALPCAQPSHP